MSERVRNPSIHTKINPKTRRVELQHKLEKVPNVKKVYFQPPANVKLTYPCIIYNRDGGISKFADNDPYNFRRRYTLTVVDPDPDSEIPDFIANHFRMCISDRTYISDNLYHHVFSLYY